MAGMFTYKTFKGFWDQHCADISNPHHRQCFWVKREVHIGVGMVIFRKHTFMYSSPKKYLHLKG